MASGTIVGTTKKSNHCSTTATTPGHTRSCCRPPVCVRVMVIRIRSRPAESSHLSVRSPAALLRHWAYVRYLTLLQLLRIVGRLEVVHVENAPRFAWS